MGKSCFIAMFAASMAVASALPQAASNQNVQGFNMEKLKALDAAMHKWVDDKNGANVVTLLARKGKIVHHDAYGSLDANAKTKVPAQKDTIYRIMSMTKPIVGAGMMIMYDQGKWKFDDPVSKHIPEFADLKVKVNGTLVAQTKPMTMAQLVSHSSGFGAMLSVNAPTLSEIIPPLVKEQLAFQPGRDWRYGPGVEIQGYLIEKWAGKDLSDFLDEKIFKPLGMVDTGFFIDPSKESRVSKLHAAKGGVLSTLPSRTATTKPKRLSPSGGLLSTAEDYFKFLQMLLNGGEANGNRIIKDTSVKLMYTNVLEPDVGVKFGGSSGQGIGFGVDFAVVMDPAPSNNNQPKGSYYWGGAYGTWEWSNPETETIFVGMIQNSGSNLSGDGSLRQISAKAVYAALEK